MAKKNNYKSSRKNDSYKAVNPLESSVNNVSSIPLRGMSARNIAVDIYSGKSSTALSEKYERSIEEINAFLEKSYACDRKTLKELRSYLQRADEHEKKSASVHSAECEEKKSSPSFDKRENKNSTTCIVEQDKEHTNTESTVLFEKQKQSGINEGATPSFEEKEAERIMQEAIARFDEQECERTKKLLNIPTISFETNEPEKTEIESIRELISIAEANLNDATQKHEKVEAELSVAYANKKDAEKTLREAEAKKEQADDEVRRIESRIATCLKEKQKYKLEFDKLNEQLQILCSKPKLLHVSAIDSESKRIEGTVYVSRWDYEHMSDELKGLVTIVDTEGMDLNKYPKDFMRYPERMGMDAFKSACEFALAYMKLNESEDCNELELICCDELVVELAKLQV